MKDKRTIYNFILEFWEFMKLFFPLPKYEDRQSWDVLSEKSTELAKKWDDKGDFGRFCRKVIVDWMEYVGKTEKRT